MSSWDIFIKLREGFSQRIDTTFNNYRCVTQLLLSLKFTWLLWHCWYVYLKMESKITIIMGDPLKKIDKLFYDGGLYHIETRPLICRANQRTSFYMIGTTVIKELIFVYLYRPTLVTSFLRVCMSYVICLLRSKLFNKKKTFRLLKKRILEIAKKRFFMSRVVVYIQIVY